LTVSESDRFAMDDRSREKREKKSAFLGLYVSPLTKERVKAVAKARGISISEVVRQRLRFPEPSAKTD